MDLRLRDKRVLVTGSSAGIGFAAAVGFAREGAAVILNGRSADRLESARARLADAVPNASVRAVAADVGTAEGCAAVIEAVPDVEVLVNNTGIFEPKPFAEIPDEDWLRFYEVNVLSGVRLSRHYLPRMLAKNEGRILFVSSESGLNIPVEMIHYGMTKTAQLAVARGLAEMTRGTNVTVNSVLPGPTASEGVSDFMAKLARDGGTTTEEVQKQFFATVRPTSIIQRLASPAEIANTIVYLASPLASTTNGAAIRAEGGILHTIA